MTRDRPNKLWTTYDWADEARQIPTFGDYDGGWGGEVTIGRRFCCGCAPWAIELTYWGLDGPDSYSNPGDAAALYGTPFNLSATGGLQIRGIPATAWFDGSPSHRVWRKDEVHDVEVNLVRNQLVGGPCQRWNVDWLVGFRFFKFRDHLVFGAENAGTGEWAYLDDHVRNYLWGPQTGVNVDYRFAERWRAFVRPVIGAFYNHSTIDYDIHAGADHATQTAYPSIQYPVSASSDHLSFLTQVDFGLGWQITPRLELKGGYRVVALTGMALAEAQVPFYAVDTEAVADIDHNGNLVLHGAFFGATYSF